MTKPPTPKRRSDVMKQHYWLQLDLEVRAETLESAFKRAGQLFRKAFRTKIVEGLVYMGAHTARCRGSLHAKRTMHPTVVVTKGLPIKPGVTLQELDAEEALRRERKEKRVGRVALDIETGTPGSPMVVAVAGPDRGSEPHIIAGVPKPTVVTGPTVPVRGQLPNSRIGKTKAGKAVTAKPAVVKVSRFAALMQRKQP